MDRLQSMEIFVAAVDRGSFTAAARVFRLTPPMVGKHIRFLEQRLGARLLTRTTRRQALTEIGRQYYGRCKRILEEVRSAEAGAEAMRAAPRGELRISAGVSFGSLRLSPALADYLATYPEVTVQLNLSDQFVDLIEEGYDAAIRIGELADSSLIARPLQPYRMMICASPAYLKRMGTPRTPADLVRHACLGFSNWSRGGGWRLGRENVTESDLPTCRFQSNNGQALRTAAMNGLGIVMQSEVILAEDVAAGRLVEVLPDFLPPPRPMHLIYPRDRQATPKLTTFVEFVLERFGVRSRQSARTRVSPTTPHRRR
jgi:DNA-binding transcriptional LysR family regulator